jgi:hypothetical protein
MSSTSCRGCGAPLASGEALVVLMPETGEVYVVHRPLTGNGSCFRSSVPPRPARIALLDERAAHEHDRLAGGGAPLREALGTHRRAAERAAADESAPR